ncbi:MAG: hypothetical protein CTY34_09515 [Methylobacter sp.]|nr:MAG: hypothetical protein CTY34_09515 [Methylobacter sp.]PPD17350.1 MAG: hypothetical protein CTY24_15075 [Methylobacter sp.]PPD35975.1 MAG: hypothetical protein CTY18_05720 [Methylomonas sp.]
MSNPSSYKKAMKMIEVDNAVRFDVPLPPNHEFYTDFSDVRGDFEDRMIYKNLNANPKTFIYNREVNRENKVILFLAGMRGSGKTSELAKIADKLNHPDGFFCVTCNLDDGLDLNDMEYMDILIFQTERLFEQLNQVAIVPDAEILKSLQLWFSERVKEVNKVIKQDGGLELEIGAETPSILSFLKIAAKLKANLTGSKENADKIRASFRNNFTDFAQIFNEFIEHVNLKLRKDKIAQEILFIVDGLEKTATLDMRKKVIMEENNRIRQIKANTIFTLPIELMPEANRLNTFSRVVSFPFVKIRERNGNLVEQAVKRFEEFVYKRIDPSLFDSHSTVTKAVLYSGGSPRELLRILEYANMYADEDAGIITESDLNKGIKKLAAETSQYVSKDDLTKLKELKDANKNGIPLPFDDGWQDLLEKLIVLEYNDGSYKRVNPVVEESPLYQQYVG